MSKDIYNRNLDLSWFPGSTGSFTECYLGNTNISKSCDINNELEPWEPTSETKVCRNLNSTWENNESNALPLKQYSLSLGKLSMDNCSSIVELNAYHALNKEKNMGIYENLEQDLNNCYSFNQSQQQCKLTESLVGSSVKNTSKDSSPTFSNEILNSNECTNQDQIFLSHLISYLNENKVVGDQSNKSCKYRPLYHTNPLTASSTQSSSLYPQIQPDIANTFASNIAQQSPELKNNTDATLFNFYAERYSPPSPCSSKSSPRTNTDLVALMQELAIISGEENLSKLQSQNLSTPFQSPPSTPGATPTKGCVFCKNNSYHSTFYKSHILKDDRGHCQCPVLRTYVCPLCGGTGDSAHTLKYCPRNTVTRGDPIAAGLPPGKVTNWREVASKMATQHKS